MKTINPIIITDSPKFCVELFIAMIIPIPLIKRPMYIIRVTCIVIIFITTCRVIRKDAKHNQNKIYDILKSNIFLLK